MEKLKTKLIGLIIALLVITLILPIQVLAAEGEAEIQIVKTATEDYIIYVKGVTESFKYALAEESDITDEMLLNYINSTTDDSEAQNNVALVAKDEVATSKYIYIKSGEEVTVTSLNFENAFSVEEMEEVETTTKRIPTTLVTDLVEKDEEVDGVQVTVTVGGIKITDEGNATYSYFYKKLPAEKYSTLMELAEKINAEYNEMDMYSKIEIAKEFSALYNELKNSEEYTLVENMTIMQPNDAQDGEQYIVFLKKADETGSETIDIKLMTSYRTDEEEKIPGKIETVAVKETAKLPITGDSLLLFAILAVIILVAVVVFIRIKKLQGKQRKH